MTTPAVRYAVDVRGLTKFYGTVKALDAVDLRVADGEYFVLLGPSGGGKTTLLRLIGGFIRPSSGTVLLQGEDVSSRPPERRPTGMVFQSYALFPHMSVAQNVAYGLKLRRVPAIQIAEQVGAALAQVSMQGYEDRRPWELSGGQQQRVQLARALVLKPRILLLDEPLAALDASLRKDMCYELKQLQEQTGITFVHVTHNQEEAMTVADQIAVIADARLVEQGSTRQVYETPRERFTAGFIGERNLFDARVIATSDDSVTLATAIGDIVVPDRSQRFRQGESVCTSVRSESIALHTTEQSHANTVTVTAIVREQIYLGLTTQTITVLASGQAVSARALKPATETLTAGQQTVLSWPASAMSIHRSGD